MSLPSCCAPGRGVPLSVEQLEQTVKVFVPGVVDLAIGEHAFDELLDRLLGVEADDGVRDGGTETDVVV